MSRHNKANMPLLSCNDTQGMIALIDQRQSFRVKAEDWEQLWECGQWIEDCLDAADMSSRVYTKGRLAAAAVPPHISSTSSVVRSRPGIMYSGSTPRSKR